MKWWTSSRYGAAGLSAVLLSTLAVSALPTASSAQPTDSRAAVETRISQTPAFDAPVGRKGGISNPVVFCSDSSEPTTTWTLTNLDTEWTRTWSWRGSFPNQYFPRVPVGDYRSDTVGKCRGVTKSRSQKVAVEEKTPEGTVSRVEWSSVRLGMTRAEVATVVGNNGRDPYRYAGDLTVTYDLMGFWRWSIIKYRGGHVTAKLWNVAHD